MTQWHQTLKARIGLRIGGLILLGLAWTMGVHLRTLVMAIAPAGPTPIEMLDAAAMLVSACAGSALLLIGPGLWMPVRISERWSQPLPEAGHPGPYPACRNC